MTFEGWEFGGIVIAHGLAVASPGPDFALVIRQSLVRGRSAALASAVGIGCGILIHVTYSLLGIGLLVSRNPSALVAFKYLGAGYLAWLGWNALRAQPAKRKLSNSSSEVPRETKSAWMQGFLTNVLNLKASFFFVALFSAVSENTPKSIQVFYGGWMVLATMVWFVLVALVFTKPKVRATFLDWGVWLDRLTGIVFLGFALSLAFAEVD